MSEKKNVEARDADGFIVLRRKEEAPESPPQEVPLTVKSSPTNKEKRDKKKSEKKELLYWYYDDERTVGSVIVSKAGFSEPVLLKNETERNNHSKKLKKQKVKPSNPRALPIGVDVFSDDYYQNVKLEISAFNAFRKMTLEGQSGKDRLPILKLVAVILSSYVIRSLLEIEHISKDFKLDKKDLRAINLVVSRSENGFFDLERICTAMIISTAVNDDKRLKLNVPSVISPESNQDITEIACLQVRKFKEYKWPSPYRDTSVLVDSRTVKDKDMTSLAALNPWCSFVIYGKNAAPNKMCGYSEKINSNNLTFADVELPSIHSLVAAYVATVPSLFGNDKPKFIGPWRQSGVYLEEYAEMVTKKDKLSDVDRFKLRVEISAFLAFLQFVQEKFNLPGTDMYKFWNPILEIFLPGYAAKTESADKSESSESALEAVPAPVRSPQAIFEEVLQQILMQENLVHFYPIPNAKNALWPEQTENGTEVWGYIKHFKWTKKGCMVPCLVFLKKDLVNLSQEMELSCGSFKDVLCNIGKENLEYLHTSKNLKFRRRPDFPYAQPPALRLKISDIPISEDMKQALLAKAVK